MTKLLTIIIFPITLVILCVAIFVYSYKRGGWDKQSVVAIVITLILAVMSIIQCIGNLYSSAKEEQELKNNQSAIIKRQDDMYEILKGIRVSLDDNDEVFRQEEENDELLWGPARETFTMNSPATYAVFNSITDNPSIGDERDFVKIGEIKPDVTSLGNKVEIVPGKQYLVYIYFHNDASPTYNDSEHNNEGVAIQSSLSVLMPDTISSMRSEVIKATITAENTKPGSVWDTVELFTAEDGIRLKYVSGSAKIYNDWNTNGMIIPSSFLEKGTLLGLNELNGMIPGCDQYNGVASFVIEAEKIG